MATYCQITGKPTLSLQHGVFATAPWPIHVRFMGVPGLWAQLKADKRTLAGLAWEFWDDNHRCLSLGVDASLWLFHVRKARGGVNADLRALFFRLMRLQALPVVPVFVFDGPDRPHFKRNAVVQGMTHAIETQFKEMLDACGYAAWSAPGEAEAELATLNSCGVIDAVLTDDVDALVFGAVRVIRNTAPEAHPASSRHAAGYDDADDGRSSPEREKAPETVSVYNAKQQPLTPDAMILVALLSGGDYDVQGLARCGIRVRRTSRYVLTSDVGQSLALRVWNKPFARVPNVLP